MSNLDEGDFVFKAYYWGAEYGLDDFEFMRMDAIVRIRGRLRTRCYQYRPYFSLSLSILNSGCRAIVLESTNC